jgi:hypothetical protein
VKAPFLLDRPRRKGSVADQKVLVCITSVQKECILEACFWRVAVERLIGDPPLF